MSILTRVPIKNENRLNKYFGFKINALISEMSLKQERFQKSILQFYAENSQFDRKLAAKKPWDSFFNDPPSN